MTAVIFRPKALATCIFVFGDDCGAKSGRLPVVSARLLSKVPPGAELNGPWVDSRRPKDTMEATAQVLRAWTGWPATRPSLSPFGVGEPRAGHL